MGNRAILPYSRSSTSGRGDPCSSACRRRWIAAPEVVEPIMDRAAAKEDGRDRGAVPAPERAPAASDTGREGGSPAACAGIGPAAGQGARVRDGDV